MARLPRIEIPGLPQHLIVRGNNRTDLFTDDMDRSVFMRYLQEALNETTCHVHAYVLMTNHVHMLATAAETGALSTLMQSIGRRYARFVNSRHERTGTLFEGRFKSSLVQSERYFLTCMRYIEENPVRAGMVQAVGDFSWSSHAQNATGSPSGLLVPHAEYMRLAPDASMRGLRYRALFNQRVAVADLEAIRQSASKNRVLGESSFRRSLSAQLGRPAGITRPGRPNGRENVT